MASSSSLTRKPLLKETKCGPLLLRDFLMEDFSSCSSNGFKSFPRRRQCCPTTPRLTLPPIDRRSKSKSKSKPNHRSNSSTKIFRKASKAVIRAVKSLPLRSSGAGGSRKKQLNLLPRSLSRKLLMKSLFWRREEIIHDAVVVVAGDVAGAVTGVPVTGRWRSFREFLEEQVDDHIPPPRDQASLDGKIATLASTVAAGRVSTSSDSTRSKSGSKNWSESEFTADSGGGSEGGKNDLPSSSSADGVSGGSAAVTAGDEVSTAETAKAWTNNGEEKEQFSPVSVLDCPFQDEEDEDEDEDRVSSPLHQGPVRDQGSKKKPTKRVRRFECLDQLQPINLQKRITVIEESSSSFSSSSSSSSERVCYTSHSINVGPKDPLELLRMVKERAILSSDSDYSLVMCSISKGDQLLFLDFFEEKLLNRYVEDDDDELLEAVEEWVRGEAKEMLVGWEVNESRNVYLKDIEENGGWRNYVVGVEQEIGLEMEDEIFTSLVNELVLEIC